MNHILFATDGSDGSKRAAAYIAPRAKRYGSTVTIIHVSDAETPKAKRLPATGIDNPTEAQIAHLERAWHALAAVVPIFRQHDVPVTTHVRQSEAFEREICQVADERGCDLIVVGKRGLSPVVELVFGSVTEGVIKHAKQAVLVVH
jgi:nucleotide-binding universal stress UspA family protein